MTREISGSDGMLERTQFQIRRGPWARDALASFMPGVYRIEAPRLARIEEFWNRAQLSFRSQKNFSENKSVWRELPDLSGQITKSVTVRLTKFVFLTVSARVNE